MMNLWRNPEVRHALLLYVGLSAAAVLAAGAWEARFAGFVLVLCICFIALHTVITYRRYRQIARMAEETDKILHGKDHLALEQFAEGELGILQSEIVKMTVRLREQRQKLLEDKIYLADSMADISHQIRTPLTSIHLLIPFLSEPGLEEGRRLELVRELHERLSHIDGLITALLKISRLDAGTVSFKRERIPARRLLEKAAEPLLVSLELREQELSIRAEGDFTGDPEWMREALTNILKNCMEHTPGGGRIAVEAAENAICTEIIISDNGRGIREEDLPHIFERFYKGKEDHQEGFGIGLALSRTIIAAQNGTIKAENIAPHGARFTIRMYRGPE